MSLNLTYPGVYIQELPSPVHTITGVSTSVTAFIGSAPQGPIDSAELIHSFADYERIYGELSKTSKMSYAVYQYYLNGGSDAIIIRVVSDDAVNAIFVSKDTNLVLQASNPGTWANKMVINIDNNVKPDSTGNNPDPTLFNLYVNLPNGNIVETFLNVSSDPSASRFIGKILEVESNFIRVYRNLDANNGDQMTPPLTSLSPDPNIKIEIKKPAAKEIAGQLGTDGAQPSDNNILGNDDKGAPTTSKTGLNLLDEVDIFNLLCIPPYNSSDETSVPVYAKAISYSAGRRAMVIVDPPSTWTNKDVAKKGMNSSPPFMTLKDNAILYFPRILSPDPVQEYRDETFVPCGAIAGIIATTDSNRGVWKSPAGIDTNLMGVTDLQVHLTNAENGELNPLGINCLMNKPGIGSVVWGARTMVGADIRTDQWKYLSVRRMAFYIEESLYRGTQWVVFEPNDEPLWSQIRLNVGAFMQDLFRKGAFQGSTPKEAYLVKCDHETTTQNDIDRGIVNIVVGFAPLKPAEFVVIQIKQLAGQQVGG